jgi:hypothetical protein
VDGPVAVRSEQLQYQESLFRVGDRFLRLATDRPEILEYVDRAYRRLKVAVSSETAGPVDRCYVGWDGTAATLSFEETALPRLDVSGPIEAGERGAASMFAMSFRRMQTERAVYAAGVAQGSHAVALFAPRGAGKTTLLLEMLYRGWQTFGDEFLLLERQTRVARPFPLGLAIREASLPLCADPRVARACAAGSLATGGRGARRFHGIDIVDVFGAASLSEARPLTDVVLFERDSLTAPVLERIAPAVAALRILPHFFIDRLAMPDVWETIDAVSRSHGRRPSLRRPRGGATAP